MKEARVFKKVKSNPPKDTKEKKTQPVLLYVPDSGCKCLSAEFLCGITLVLLTHNTDFLLASKMNACILMELS